MKVDNYDELRDIFWTHLDVIALEKKFHLISIMDNTFKTCKDLLSLHEIVGVTSTRKIFYVAFAYFQSWRIDNFVRTLQRLTLLITCGDVNAIVTD